MISTLTPTMATFWRNFWEDMASVLKEDVKVNAFLVVRSSAVQEMPF
jgi:hypothetical protein